MKRIKFLWLCGAIFLLNCQHNSKVTDIEKWKSEVVQTENEFNQLAQKEGLSKAFMTYAAEDGVIKRGRDIIKGKQAIGEWYVTNGNPNETLTWEPDYVDVSASGDMAYTYGSYIFTTIDASGNKQESRGKFHTVWKKQADGSWKFVYD